METETTQAAEQTTDRDWLTHSSEQAWKTCPRKFALQYRLGLVPLWDSEPLRIGSVYHVGLEMLKKGMTEDQAVAACELMYATTPCPPYLETVEYEVEEQTVIALLRGYARRYAGDMIVEYIANERKFNLPIINPETGRPTPSFTSAGKIDGIARLPDLRIALVEHKTTSESIEPASDYWRKLTLDAQLSRYVLAARAEGFPVETTIYDVTRKPQIKPKNVTKADQARATSIQAYFSHPLIACVCPEHETPEMYGARLLDDLQQRPDFYFARMEVPRLDSDLMEFTREQWLLQLQIRDADLKSRSWGLSAYPRNTGACTSPYRCRYLDICRGTHGDPTESIPDGFKRAERFHSELVEETVSKNGAAL